MNNTYQIYLISDSTGETLDRIFLALKAQFKKYKWSVIDVTRKSVEETAASVIKIYEIEKENV